MKKVSYSEIKCWTDCRMKWWFSYNQGLKRRVSRRTPQLGSACHIGLASNLVGQNWGEAIDDWATKQGEGLFEEERMELKEICFSAKDIVNRYTDNYSNEPFKPLAVERRFEIPLPGSIRGQKLVMVGYWDAIVEDINGKNWVLEHKFPTSFYNENALDLNSQIGIYEWAANMCGYNVVGTIFDECLNKTLTMPSVNKDGSVSRARIACDWKTYKQFLIDNGQDPANYAEMEQKLDVRFFKRTYLFRGKSEQETFKMDLQRKLWDMSSKHIYRAESQMNCGMCDFREPCLSMLKGFDVQDMLNYEFEKKGERVNDETKQVDRPIKPARRSYKRKTT